MDDIQVERIEATLAASREKLRRVVDAAAEALVQIDSTGLINGWSRQATLIFGWSEDEAIGQNMDELIIPHRYREAHRRGMRHYLDSGQGTALNHRIALAALHRDGHEFPIELTLLDPIEIDGRIEFCGLVRDTTEQHEHAAEQRLSAMVYQVIGEAILVADHNNRIIAVNPAFTALTGYSEQEVIARSTNLLKSGRQGAAFYRQMWQALEATGRWQGEIWNRKKNGDIYAEWLMINTIYDDNGEVLRRVAMFSDITEKKRAEATIWRQANYDPLTDLPNRNLFQDRLQQELKGLRSKDKMLALMLIDLDNFKEINDTLGHSLGDLLLVEAARRISRCVREGDTVARLGGDEFAIVLANLDDAVRIEQVAQMILREIARPYRLGKDIAHLSTSVGIALYPADAEDIESLIRSADQAMYAAKARGRNGYVYSTATMQRDAQERQRLANDLRGALALGQLSVHYQPIVNLTSGTIVKAEALLRWRHPTRGMVGPAEFITLAEQIGLIGEIGDWVFREAAKQVKAWLAADADCVQVSINKSPRQFVERKESHDWIDYLKQLDLPTSCINVEITEGLLLDDRAEVAEKLVRFRDAGIQVSIDDFGTGYSAMSYLKKFHIDYLKIDQSFVRDMASDPADRAIVEAIVVMAHKLGLKVIAEGVETSIQRDLLIVAGCDFGQGYLFARPMPQDEFLTMLLACRDANLAGASPGWQQREPLRLVDPAALRC